MDYNDRFKDIDIDDEAQEIEEIDFDAQERRHTIYFITFVILIICIGFGTYFYINSKKEYIEGNVLHLAYVDTDSARRGVIATPWKNQQIFISMLYRTLLMPTAGFEDVTPDLAESYEILDDGATYKFVLKDGIVWSDGKPITVDDLAFTIESMLLATDIGTIYVPFLDKIEGAKEFKEDPSKGLSGISCDGNTFTLRMAEKYHAGLQVLAQIVILPKHAFVDADIPNLLYDDYWANPIVSGMYKVGSFTAGEYLSLVPNDKYVGKRSSIAEVRLHIDYRRQKLDYYATNSIAEMVDFSGKKDFRKYDVDMLFYRYFISNIRGKDGVSNEKMENPLVRKALAYAIDRKSLLYDMYFNVGTLIDSGVPRAQLDNAVAYDYDPEKAKQLLEEANYDFSQPIRIGYYYTDETSIYFINAVAQNLHEVGLKTELVPLIGNARLIYDVRQYDITLKGFGAFTAADWYGEYLSIHPQMTKIFDNKGEFDELVEHLSTEVDPVKYKNILKELVALEHEKMYKIPLFTLNQSVYINEKRLSIPKGITFGNVWYRSDVKLEDWAINKE